MIINNKQKTINMKTENELNGFFNTQQGKILINNVKELLKYNASDSMIESKLWAKRAQNVGMRHINGAIERAKK